MTSTSSVALSLAASPPHDPDIQDPKISKRVPWESAVQLPVPKVSASLQVFVDVLQFSVERPFADAQGLGGLAPVSVELLECAADELLLRLV